MNEQIKYCLPLIVSDSSEAEEAVRRNTSSYTFFEIWLDYLKDPEPAWISRMIEEYPGRLIFLFRRKNLEQIKMAVSRREEIIRIISSAEAMLDLDISSQEHEIEFINSSGLRPGTILSYHNYRETPEPRELRAIISRMDLHGAFIHKVACMCTCERDAFNLIELCMALKEEGKKYIVLGMGQHGKLTRVVCTLWGNQMLFAPADSASVSAPGQLTKTQLDGIFVNLK